MKRVLVIVGGVLLALGAAVVPAGAQTDDYVPPASTATVNADGSITVAGSCPGSSSVSYEVRRGNSTRGQLVDSGTASTDDDGDFTFTTQPQANGQYTIVIRCGERTEVLRVNVNRGQGGGAVGGPTPGGAQAAPDASTGIEVLGDGTSRIPSMADARPASRGAAGLSADRAAAANGLPRTGSDPAPLAQLGVALVTVGGLVIYGTKKRRALSS